MNAGPVAVGQPVTLSFDPAKLHVFDPATARRSDEARMTILVTGSAGRIGRNLVGRCSHAAKRCAGSICAAVASRIPPSMRSRARSTMPKPSPGPCAMCARCFHLGAFMSWLPQDQRGFSRRMSRARAWCWRQPLPPRSSASSSPPPARSIPRARRNPAGG